mgnify:FL=1
MGSNKLEDVRDTAVKLGVIYSQSPTDYAYLKGWIHCLLQKGDNLRKPHKPPTDRTA